MPIVRSYSSVPGDEYDLDCSNCALPVGLNCARRLKTKRDVEVVNQVTRFRAICVAPVFRPALSCDTKRNNKRGVSPA
jgi:hypothetical protein